MKKVLIDVRDDIYDTCVNEYHNGTPFLAETVIARGKVLSDMTNGDVIKAIFPLIEEVTREISSASDNIVVRDNSLFGAINRFHTDWWNAPYKKDCIPSEYDYSEDMELRNPQMHS